MNIQPMGTNVIVKRIMQSKTSSGIYIPTNVKKQALAQAGQILAVGPEVSEYAPKDFIMFTKFQGTGLSLIETCDEFGFDFKGDKTTEYLILEERDIIAKLNSFVEDKGYKGE